MGIIYLFYLPTLFVNELPLLYGSPNSEDIALITVGSAFMTLAFGQLIQVELVKDTILPIRTIPGPINANHKPPYHNAPCH